MRKQNAFISATHKKRTNFANELDRVGISIENSAVQFQAQN